MSPATKKREAAAKRLLQAEHSFQAVMRQTEEARASARTGRAEAIGELLRAGATTREVAALLEVDQSRVVRLMAADTVTTLEGGQG